MASSGYASRTPAPFDGRDGAAGRTHASLKIGNSLRNLAIGTSGPIDAGVESAQEAWSPGESIERGRTICEYIEIMHILPGSSDNALLINASRLICNITTKSEQSLGHLLEHHPVAGR
jgi:hypothetical protein